jgi:hypothetical protein
MDTLYDKGSFFVFQEAYPYCLARSLLVIRLEHKKDEHKGKMYELKLMCKDDVSQREQLEDELGKSKITFASRKYPPSLPSTLEQRYQDIGLWAQVLKEHFEEEHEKHQDHDKEGQMLTLFNCVYQP